MLAKLRNLKTNAAKTINASSSNARCWQEVSFTPLFVTASRCDNILFLHIPCSSLDIRLRLKNSHTSTCLLWYLTIIRISRDRFIYYAASIFTYLKKLYSYLYCNKVLMFLSFVMQTSLIVYYEAKVEVCRSVSNCTFSFIANRLFPDCSNIPESNAAQRFASYL